MFLEMPTCKNHGKYRLHVVIERVKTNWGLVTELVKGIICGRTNIMFPLTFIVKIIATVTTVIIIFHPNYIKEAIYLLIGVAITYVVFFGYKFFTDPDSLQSEEYRLAKLEQMHKHK
jgi:hypothetical protein